MTDDSADPDDSILAIAIPNWMPVKSVKIGIVEPLNRACLASAILYHGSIVKWPALTRLLRSSLANELGSAADWAGLAAWEIAGNGKST